VTAFLCIKLGCLPSQLGKEDYNQIVNIHTYLMEEAEHQKNLTPQE